MLWRGEAIKVQWIHWYVRETLQHDVLTCFRYSFKDKSLQSSNSACVDCNNVQTTIDWYWGARVCQENPAPFHHNLPTLLAQGTVNEFALLKLNLDASTVIICF